MKIKNYIMGMLITLIPNAKQRKEATEEIYSYLDCDDDILEPIIKGIILKYNDLNISNVSRVAKDITEFIIERNN